MKNIILAADIGGTTCKLGIFDEQLNQLKKMVDSYRYF